MLVADSSTTKEVAFSQKDAVKRPNSLEAETHQVKVKGKDYLVIISTMTNHPYEVFVIPDAITACKKVKVVKEKKGLYNMYDEDGIVCIENIGSKVTEDEAAITRLISTALRHGTDVKHLVDQLNKTEGNMVGFSKAISRTLKKYIPEGTKSGTKCNECGGSNIIFKEGCSSCLDCGSSKCG